MLTIELLHNGQHVATAGLPGHHVLSAHVVFDNFRGDDFGARLGGLDSDADIHHDWASLRPAVGDEILIRVSEDASIEPPTRSRRPTRRETNVETADDLRDSVQFTARRSAFASR